MITRETYFKIRQENREINERYKNREDYPEGIESDNVDKYDRLDHSLNRINILRYKMGEMNDENVLRTYQESIEKLDEIVTELELELGFKVDSSH